MILEPIKIKNVTIKNRIVLPPMCMYTVTKHDGIATDFHMQHYLSRAIGGVGLIIQEATGIMPWGRITDDDLGIWNDAQVQALKPIVNAVKQAGSTMMIQLNHSGRKSQTSDNVMWAPSALQFSPTYRMPVEMSLDQIKDTKKAFIDATKKALEIGYDGVEIHVAHGYLLSTFLSPATNKRTDEYGGSSENRARLLKEILEEIRAFFPEDKILGVRVSAKDYVDGGMTPELMSETLKPFASLIDLLHVSSGGVDSKQVISDFPLYQEPFARYLKSELNIPTIAVGKITDLKQASYILKTGSADMVAFGRELLRNPFLVANYHPEYMDNYPGYSRGVKEF